jgi:hypothetical protein
MSSLYKRRLTELNDRAAKELLVYLQIVIS